VVPHGNWQSHVLCQATQVALNISRFTIENVTHAIYASIIILRKVFHIIY